MKRVLISIVIIFCAQVLYAQRQWKHSSYEEIHQYFSDNISKLDPIEGEYDVDFQFTTSSPFARNEKSSFSVIIAKNKSNGIYEVYYTEDSPERLYLGDIKIEPIGNTNVYRMWWNNSSGRGVLDKGIRVLFNIPLTSSDCKRYATNSQFAYQISLYFDMIKTYPN